MINKDSTFNVTNRSASVVIYKIPELNVRREFAPNETKRISYTELEKLSYQPGGRELMTDFLQIAEVEITENFEIHREPEYDMSEAEIKDLLLNGSIDQFLDALDFAPTGVLDLIKTLSVSLPLQDYGKRMALKNKTGFDVDRAIENNLASKTEDAKSNDTPTRRRVTTETKAESAERRTAPKYNVVSKEETSK